MRSVLVWILLPGFVLLLPHVFDSVLAISILNQMGIAILFALSYNILLGQGGMLSFGHAVYFGMGGFLAVHAMNWIEEFTLPVPLVLVPLLAGFCGLIVAVLVGSFSTRRAGTVFAMISLGIGEMVAACSLIFVRFFGGEEGVSADRTMALPFFGIEFAQDFEIYHLIAGWVLLAGTLIWMYTRTPVGRIANAVRDNPERAEFVGYSQRVVRFISFCFAGFIAGVAGGLFAVNYEILTEENLNAVASGNVLLMTYVGGTGIFFGPVIGAIVLTLLQTVVSNYTELWQLYLGVLFVMTVMYLPHGLTGFAMMHIPAVRNRRWRSLLVPYLTAALPAIAFVCSGIVLLEMVHFRNESIVGQTTLTLFSLDIDTASTGSWVWPCVLLVVSFGLARARLPAARAAFARATALGGDLRS